MQGQSVIRVLLADDHGLVRAGLKTILEQAPDIRVVAEASNGMEAIQEFERVRPDVAILDISMPMMDGMEAVKRLISSDRNGRILVLTMHPERYYAVRALKAGALGYITKGTSSQELHSAVRAVARGKRYLSNEGIDAVTIRMMAHGMDTTPVESLSDRELQVLCHIASGYKVREIAEELGVGTKTVETYRSRILRKLCLRRDADICRFAFEHGLVPVAPSSQESSPSNLMK